MNLILNFSFHQKSGIPEKEGKVASLNSYYYRGVYLWERLPVVVQTLASKSDFRKRIKVL